jgi:hypothetical protein
MLHLSMKTMVMGSARRRQKMWFVLSVVAFLFFYFNSNKKFIPFFVYRNNNVLRLRQYHRFMVMEMLLLPQSAKATFLFLMQASKPMALVLRYFYMLVAFFSSNCGRH